METGVLAGYPVVDIKATLYDGSYHEVDSSEIAFKMAGAIALREGVAKAKPVLLEPIMNMEITVSEDVMGDVIGDLNGRRGRVLGMDSEGKYQIIKAEVPMAEVLKYSLDLTSMTGGRGSFHMERSHYEEVPGQLTEKIIAVSKEEEK